MAQYCEFHYGQRYFEVPNYPQRCAELCLSYMEGRASTRALDLGCAVGRSTFELARGFSAVTGVDFSARFIETACGMKEEGCIRYSLPEEGELVSRYERCLVDLGLEHTASNVTFQCGDAQDLSSDFMDYDLIFAGNLIDRLTNPVGFLATIHKRLNPGGLLTITSPYTWLPDFTPRDNWVGGFLRNGKPVWTLDGMKELLSPRFTLLENVQQIPFVIRETRRKFQHTVAAMTVWARK